jgi:hypothetical protein
MGTSIYTWQNINQWDINIDSLDNSIDNHIKSEFKNVCPHDFLDRVTSEFAIGFNDFDFASIMRIRIVEQILFYYKLSTRNLFKRGKKTIDLFTIVTKKKLHPNFETLLRPEFELIRDVLGVVFIPVLKSFKNGY